MAGEWCDTVGRTGYAPERFTTAMYQAHVAGKRRLSGARAVLDYFSVPDAERRSLGYAECKQRRLQGLIAAGEFVAFPDALRFALALESKGVRLAAASSSKNANDEALLTAAAADLVVRTLDEVALAALLNGRLERLSSSHTVTAAGSW